ncbi:lasso peptide biosynthesis B2 protein [Coralloluteibacterium stylophorae]|uniref:Lasso peptide biosynthesis B2 protein n=1 Tax=Coralloluteibacterium stylophorae TaxID=1776034 RepID=A0A8J8AXC4_9GAMM|nr:lasso peptide biosynthesis B2 protein [Coralloluteibacterium stylophorae]MBS7456838.1 lasso peptide biosynthesis B2 protein [Coralloluteibacterium stylophorae]
MTRLGLHHDLSFCRADGRLIFLDIRNDRYFRLADDLQTAFLEHMDGRQAPDGQLRRLVQQNILVEGPDRPGHPTEVSVTRPTRSAIEGPGAESGQRRSTSDPVAVLDTFAAVCSTQLQLRTRPLQGILARLVSLRIRRAAHAITSDADASRALDAAATFRAARPFVPVQTCCLVDSIAMVRFLAKRGIHADLVFGVAGQPFAAHCWVQHRDIVLNDSVGHVSAHTPIRVV